MYADDTLLYLPATSIEKISAYLDGVTIRGKVGTE